MKRKTKTKTIAGLIVVVAIVAVAMLAGCVEEERMSTVEIKEMALATTESIDTYTFDMNMTQNIQISNETGETEMTKLSTGNGVVDNINKKMNQEMTRTMKMPSETKEMKMDMYFINNTMYTKREGIPKMPAQWRKMEMPEGYKKFWESQNQVEQQMELLNVSEMEQLEDEKVNDVDCYVLKLTPDIEKHWETVMKQARLSELMQSLQQNDSFDIGKMIKEMSIKQWIAKDTKFPMKTEMQIKMVMSSEDLNLRGDTKEKFTMTMDQRTSIVFHDYNEPVTIELPKKAESAAEFPKMTK